MNYRPLPSEATLEQRADRIRYLLIQELDLDGKLQRRRWEVGVELLAAQRLVPKGHWEEWCRANVARSQGDIQKLMAMAAKSDPQAAHEAEIQATREARAAVAKLQDAASMRPDAEMERVQSAEDDPHVVPAPSSRPILTLVPKVDPVEAAIETPDPEDVERMLRALSTSDRQQVLAPFISQEDWWRLSAGAIRKWTLADEERVRGLIADYAKRYTAAGGKGLPIHDYRGEEEPLFLNMTLKEWEEHTQWVSSDGPERFETLVAEAAGLIETIKRYRADLRKREAREYREARKLRQREAKAAMAEAA